MTTQDWLSGSDWAPWASALWTGNHRDRHSRWSRWTLCEALWHTEWFSITQRVNRLTLPRIWSYFKGEFRTRSLSRIRAFDIRSTDHIHSLPPTRECKEHTLPTSPHPVTLILSQPRTSFFLHHSLLFPSLITHPITLSITQLLRAYHIVPATAPHPTPRLRNANELTKKWRILRWVRISQSWWSLKLVVTLSVLRSVLSHVFLSTSGFGKDSF